MLQYQKYLRYDDTKDGAYPLKLITFTVPCYNSAAYMKKCVGTLLRAGDEAEILLVDDGSTDATGAIADEYAARHPGVVRAIHQENGGHGEGVNQGLRNATGLYFKVVDSDDWLDGEALDRLMALLRDFERHEQSVDLIVTNYVYEHVSDNTQLAVRYHNALPEGRVFGWNDIGRFKPAQFITMHTAVYRTALLRGAGLTLPKHTFYVDNIYVSVPLPSVRTLYYLNADLYRYFIGRDDQSVTEDNMTRRIDQQIRVTKIVADAHDLEAMRATNPRLARYLNHFLSVMLMISTIYPLRSGDPRAIALSDELWRWLRANHPATWRRMRYFTPNILFLLPGRAGRSIDLFIYRMLRKTYKFN